MIVVLGAVVVMMFMAVGVIVSMVMRMLMAVIARSVLVAVVRVFAHVVMVLVAMVMGMPLSPSLDPQTDGPKDRQADQGKAAGRHEKVELRPQQASQHVRFPEKQSQANAAKGRRHCQHAQLIQVVVIFFVHVAVVVSHFFLRSLPTS
jgi:hypothetical protein